MKPLPKRVKLLLLLCTAEQSSRKSKCNTEWSFSAKLGANWCFISHDSSQL